jgi:hypothetical protein
MHSLVSIHHIHIGAEEVTSSKVGVSNINI